MIRKLLYGNDVTIDDQTSLSDLDMHVTLPISKVGEIMDDHKIIFSDDIPTNTLCHILTICDKLARHDIIDEILAQHVILQPHTSLIIHHTLSNDAIIKLYAKTNAYNLLYGRIHHKYMPYCAPYIVPPIHNMFRDATLNGLRVTSINVYDIFMNDNHIKYCTSLTELNIYYETYNITTCARFAHSLKVLRVAYNSGIGNNSLVSCHSIKELCACSNYKITTCAPFANSLEVLDASDDCGIGDGGLALCHFIKQLNANNNCKITTCAPFANSIESLNASGDCGIGDYGLALCHSIKALVTHHNITITTCVPFAKTLTNLSAGFHCGIADVGIASCHAIKYLNAMYNPMITTCAPFAKSLTHLYTDGSGICTEGILLCKSLITLSTRDDGKIDRRKITMAKNDNRQK